MEHEDNNNGRGLATAALATAIPTAVVEILNWIGGGGLNGILGNRTACAPGERPVSATEAALMAKNAELETEKKLLESNIYTDQKTLELYRYVDGKFAAIDAQINQQAVYNATNTATLNCLAGQVAQLMSLTKVIIPINNVCPAPMPQYNSWVAPTAPSGT
jgi:hypothetical protein